MQISLEDVLIGYKSLKKLQEQSLPIIAAFYLNKIEDFLKKENSHFAEAYKDFVKRYGEKDENGNVKFDENQNPIYDKSKEQERNKEYYDLIISKIDIPNIKIPISYLEKAEISPQDLKPLMPFLTE